MDRILNRMRDVVHDPAISPRRRRLEYPRRNQSFLLNSGIHDPSSVPEATKSFVRDTILSEFAKSGGVAEGLPKDKGYVDQLYLFEKIGRPMDLGPLIHALYHRGRQQSAYWDVYEALVQRELIDPEGLRTPIAFGRITPAVGTVFWLLGCFELLSRDGMLVEEVPGEYGINLFEDPGVWLATMIIRGCGDIHLVFDTIARSKFLGDWDDEAYEKYKRGCSSKQFQVNPEELKGPYLKATGPFGFWLPHGLQGDTAEEANAKIYPDFIERFNRIEKAFKLWFGIDDDHIVLECDQQSYFEEHPDRLPGH